MSGDLADDIGMRGPEGVLGFRAVAGLRTTDGRRLKPGVLFRSATPQFVSIDDAAEFIGGCGLRTIIDLRLPHEAQREGSGGFTDSGVEIRNVPFSIRKTVSADSAVAPMTAPDPLIGTYLQYIEEQSSFATIVGTLADPDRRPVLVHCTLGKDRTGVACAVVLDALGVLRSDIAADYAAKADDLTAMMGRLRELPSYGDAVDLYPPEAATALPATLLRFLGWMDRLHGGTRRYLLESGVTEAQLTELADQLFEPDEGVEMSQVNKSITLPVAPDAVWAVVGDVANVHKWVPALTDTKMDGDVRIATFADGGQAREQITSHSDAERSLTYTYLDGPIPLDEYSSTLTVGADESGSGSLVSWTATLQADPAVVTSIDELYEVSLAKLKEILA